MRLTLIPMTLVTWWSPAAARMAGYRGKRARKILHTTVVAIGIIATACRDASAPLSATVRGPSVAASQANTITWSRGNVAWQESVNVGTTVAPNWVPAGVRGDGRNRSGLPAAPFNEYQGDYCGVRAFIYDGRGESGNLDFDPDTYYNAASMWPACGAARTMAFYLAGPGAAPTIVGPHVIVTALWTLAPGEVRLQPQTFGMQLVTCQLQFNASYTGASNVRVTRLPDLAGPVRQWRVESQGNHRAACLTPQANGKYIDTGTRYYLPFSATIVQVTFPSPSYP